MSTIPLRDGIRPDEARQAVQDFLHSWADQHFQETTSIAGEMISGRITLEEAQTRTLAVLEETEDRFRDELPEIMDRLFDFSAAPGGPVGATLEALDGPFWQGFFGLAADAGKWIVQAFTVDDLDRKRIAARLSAKALELEQKATELEDSNPKRAEHLRKVAGRKRTRSQGILQKIGA